MSRTIADASREYRQRQRGKLKRYEAALAFYADGSNYSYGPGDDSVRDIPVIGDNGDIARNALQEG